MKKRAIYAVYRGDKFIDLGTKEELAERMGCKPTFIGFLTTLSNKKRIEQKKKSYDNSLLAIRVGEEDEV